MTSIRIAIASLLVLAGAFAGGTAHAGQAQVHATAYSVALSGAPTHNSPVLCCYS
jgi:hypothetical protein